MQTLNPDLSCLPALKICSLQGEDKEYRIQVISDENIGLTSKTLKSTCELSTDPLITFELSFSIESDNVFKLIIPGLSTSTLEPGIYNFDVKLTDTNLGKSFFLIGLSTLEISKAITQ